MYYIYRLFFIIILGLAFSFILAFILRPFNILKKAESPDVSDSLNRKRKVKTVLYFVFSGAIIIFLILISLYPIEGHFIYFDSLDESLSYKFINTKSVETYDFDDCIFVVDNRDKLHCVVKSADKYKLVDFKAKNVNYIFISSGGVPINKPIVAKYSKETDKTFYYATFFSDSKPDESAVWFNDQNMVYSKSSILSTGYGEWSFYYFGDGKPMNQIDLFAYGYNAEIKIPVMF